MKNRFPGNAGNGFLLFGGAGLHPNAGGRSMEMNAEILCVGTELLLGDIVNTNAAYIARELAGAGINVYHQSVVGDNPQRLRESLKLALEQNDCVITTGGLGPTYDDLTKETVADLLGRRMVTHQASLDFIVNFFKKAGRPMTENNKKQAQMPEGAVVFHNENGTAPGLAVEEGGKIVVLLPGPPREMEPMFREQVLPYLSRFSDHVLASRNIHIFGVGESAVEQELRPLMTSRTNPTVAPYAKDGEVLLRVTASAPTRKEALALADPTVAEIVERYGDFVYGIDIGSLQAAVVKAFLERGLTLATAESCTGGLVSKRITEIPGASQIFFGGLCTYSNEMKERLLGVSPKTLEQYGAVSEQTAREMAKGVREKTGAAVGLSTTGVAGPGGGSAQKPVGLVYIGIDSAAHCDVIRLTLGRGYKEEREYIRYVASSHALYQALKAAQKS